MAERLNYQCKFEKYKEELIRLRRHFHRHPELGLQEFETSAFIQEYLGKLGYRFRIVEPTGIIAEHPCQDEAAFAGKKKVVLRAEMDALPIQEQTGLSYASENAGVMHACGHDGIVASALPKKSVKVQSECWQQVPLMENQIFFSCFITQWISLLEWQCMRDRLRL